jgi:hypothetical protein
MTNGLNYWARLTPSSQSEINFGTDTWLEMLTGGPKGYLKNLPAWVIVSLSLEREIFALKTLSC